MAKSSSVEVSADTATLVAVSDSGGQAEVIVSVPDSATVYFGDADVTTITGIPVVGAANQTFRLGPKDKLYGVGAATVAVFVAQLGFE